MDFVDGRETCGHVSATGKSVSYEDPDFDFDNLSFVEGHVSQKGDSGGPDSQEIVQSP